MHFEQENLPAHKSGKPFEITGKHVLFSIIAFFGVIIATNMVFVTLAVKSFPGEQVEKSYYQGLNYNDSLAEKARQKTKGWHMLLLETPALQGQSFIDVKLLDRAGEPIYNAVVVGALSRPTTDLGQQDINFYPLRDGVYRTEPAVLEAGAWDLELSVRQVKEGPIELSARTRISVQ